MISVPSARFLAVVLAGALLVVGCGVSNGDRGGPSAEPAATSSSEVVSDEVRDGADALDTWTVLVYLAADNNLEQQAIGDIEEMSKAPNTRFLVLLDRAPGYSTDDVAGLGGDFEGTAWLDIQNGEIEAREVEEVNTGDPEVLASFVEEGLEAAPDGHHALVIWNHGGAWRGAAWDDSSDHDHLSVPEISQGIAEGLDRVGVDGLDLIGFDACNMATYEVAAAMAPHAAYLLASEELEPGVGWDWTDLGTPAHGTTTRDLAANVIDGFVAQNDQAGSTDTTLSLLDLTQTPLLDAAAEELAEAIRGDGAEQVGRIGAARASTQSFARSPDPRRDQHLVSLGHLADHLRQVEGTRDAAVALGDAVDRMVVHSTAGPAAPGASGVAAYFPPGTDLLDEEYHPLELAPAWSEVLDAFYEAARHVDPAALPLYTDQDRYLEGDQLVETGDELTLRAEVQEGAGASIVDAVLRWGEVHPTDANVVTWFGSLNADVDGDRLSGTYDWSVLQLTVGDETSFAFSDERYDELGQLDLIEVPIRFESGADELYGNLVVTIAHGRIHSRFFLSTGEMFFEYIPREGDRFVPLLASQDLTTLEITWIPTRDEPFDATQDLDFAYERMPPGAPIMAGLELVDIQGNEDAVYYGTASP